MDPQELIVTEARKLYCPPDGAIQVTDGAWGPTCEDPEHGLPVQDVMLLIWADMLEGMMATWTQARQVLLKTPKDEWSDLGKGFLIGLGIEAPPATPVKNPAAEEWIKKFNNFRQRMYDYEVIIKALYNGGIEGVPKDYSFSRTDAVKHHSGSGKKKLSISEMPYMFRKLVVQPILIGTTATLGQAASTIAPNTWSYSKVGVWPDVVTPYRLTRELKGVSDIGSKIADASWMERKAINGMYAGKSALEGYVSDQTQDLLTAARMNTQDPTAMKALADREFEDYASRAKTKIRSGVMPIAALGGLALLLMMKK